MLIHAIDVFDGNSYNENVDKMFINPRSKEWICAQLETEINAVWDARDTVTVDTKGAVRDAVASALDMLDLEVRVAEPLGDHQWKVNQWLKKAVLLSFRLNDMQSIPSETIYRGWRSIWWDKIAPKFSGWDDARFRAAVCTIYGAAFFSYCTKCRSNAQLC